MSVVLQFGPDAKPYIETISQKLGWSFEQSVDRTGTFGDLRYNIAVSRFGDREEQLRDTEAFLIANRAALLTLCQEKIERGNLDFAVDCDDLSFVRSIWFVPPLLAMLAELEMTLTVSIGKPWPDE